MREQAEVEDSSTKQATRLDMQHRREQPRGGGGLSPAAPLLYSPELRVS
jgi:hypothetical protein